MRAKARKGSDMKSNFASYMPPASDEYFYEDSEEYLVEEAYDWDVENSLSEETSSSYEGSNPTREQLQDLFNRASHGERLNQDELLALLAEALSQENGSKVLEENEESVESQDLPEDEEPLEEENPDVTAATRVENGVRYYVAEVPGQEFALHAGDENITSVIESNGSVSIIPKNFMQDTATLYEEGDYVVVKVLHEGQEEIFKIHKKAKIHIALDADRVSGNIQNLAGNVKIGSVTPQRYISTEKSAEVASKISNSMSLVGIGAVSFGSSVSSNNGTPVGVNNNFNNNNYQSTPPVSAQVSEEESSFMYSVGGNRSQATQESEEVKRVLGLMSQALQSSDEVQKKDLWSQVVFAVDQWKGSDDPKKDSSANNKAQLLFNVLYGQLGESGLKEALQLGIIPDTFSESLALCLECRADENTNIEDEITDLQKGGTADLGWSHSTSASFLRQNKNSLEEEVY